jgi:GDPmannose 4,6-dehydratase
VAADTTSRRALITGLTGQDGSFLAELLLAEGYRLSAIVRGRTGAPLGASEHLRGEVELIPGDLLDHASLRAAVERVRPDELYHLAAPSFVPASWAHPAQTLTAIAGATAALLEAVRDTDPAIRFFAAASGAMFGAAPESPQREDTPCVPETPYAIAKLAAHQALGALRDQRSHGEGEYAGKGESAGARGGLFACSGILFNHESERRPERFVTRKITHAAAAISLGRAEQVVLGDLGAVRDWSFAGDVVRGAWLALQQASPGDYILASGVGRTVADFAESAFACVGLRAADHVRVDPALVRAPEATPLVGDPAKARRELGWQPQLSFEELVQRMVRADLEALQGAAR